MFSFSLKFGCNQCGECCRQMRIPLNHCDIQRIRAHLPDTPPQTWLHVHPVEASAQDAVWIEGRSSLILLRVQTEDKACVFLKDNACSIYPVRPRVCRIWPFEQTEKELRISPPHHLLVSLACDRTPFREQRQIKTEIVGSEAEYRAYRHLIKQWNHETHQHPEKQTLLAFLNFLNAGDHHAL